MTLRRRNSQRSIPSASQISSVWRSSANVQYTPLQARKAPVGAVFV